jgi:hypothetical protein
VSISRLSVTKRLFKGDNTKMRVHWKNCGKGFLIFLICSQLS